MTNEIKNMNSAKALLIEKYSFAEEELRGFDALKFVKDLELETREFSKDLLVRYFEQRKERYKDDGLSDLYHFISREAQGEINKDSKIIRIGVDMICGNRPYRMVVDTRENIYFCGDMTAHNLGNKQILEDIYLLCNIEQNIQEKKEKSFESMSWKIVCELEDGTLCGYQGYTEDLRKMPQEIYTISHDVIELDRLK